MSVTNIDKPDSPRAAAPDAAQPATRMSAEERRGQILDVTGDLVAAGGFGAVSIESVARGAGISRPIVYQHFGSLDGLIDALLERESERAVDQLACCLPHDLSAGDPAARLDQANAELNAGKARLAKIRARLDQAVSSLNKLLVDVYKSGRPDLIGIILDSSSWDDLVSRSEYLQQLQDYDAGVVDSVRGLREEASKLVIDLAEIQQRVKTSVDEVAARHAELEQSRAQLDQRRAELQAAQASRRARLGALDNREQALAKELAPKGLGPGATATLLPNGQAVAPAGAPLAVRAVIDAANAIATKPYIWGGGHGSFDDAGYDCSGAISYAFHGGGLLDSPLDSTGFSYWGDAGPGTWISVYANSGHAYAVIAGLRWDTSGNVSGTGPRWHSDLRDNIGFIARHPSGY